MWDLMDQLITTKSHGMLHLNHGWVRHLQVQVAFRLNDMTNNERENLWVSFHLDT